MAQAYLLKIPYNYQKEDGCCEVRVLQKYFADLIECVKYLQDIVDKKVVIDNDVFNSFLDGNNVPMLFEELISEESKEFTVYNKNSVIGMFEYMYPVNTLFEHYVTILTTNQIYEKNSETFRS